MVKALNCRNVLNEFKLQLRYHIQFRTNTFGKNMNPLILPVMGKIVPQQSSKDGFGII